MCLEQADQKHLRAALGYVELGMFDEANAEIERMAPLCRRLYEVFALRVAIFCGLGKWDLMEIVARKLVERNPKNPRHHADLAYATRRAESLHAAYAILIRAAELHPNSAIVQFNLACYEAQLGNLRSATAHLTRATALDKKYGSLALGDPDLRPLWKALAQKLA